MKRISKQIAICLLLSAIYLVSLWAGDGQIDIATLPYTINQSGSYIVTNNLTLLTQDTYGITIVVDNVTIDLNGHTLTGAGKAVGATGSGIYVSSTYYNIAIRNGTVRDWRQNGVDGGAYNSQFKNLRCYNNGGNGIYAGIGSLVKENNCTNNAYAGVDAGTGSTVSQNTCYFNYYDGIYTGEGCTINGNTSNQNGSDGIGASMDSSLRGNTCRDNGDDGIIAGSGSTIIENTCYSNEQNGIYAYEGSTVSGNTCHSNTLRGICTSNSCTVSRNTCRLNGSDGISANTGSLVSGNTCGTNIGDGIEVNFSCRVVDNSCSSNGSGADGAGINATNSGNSIEHNQVNNNDRGIDCNPATGNYIASNRASGNTWDYWIVAGNVWGNIINMTAGGQIATTDPYANFRY